MERSSTEGAGKMLASNTALFTDFKKAFQELHDRFAEQDRELYLIVPHTDKGNPIIQSGIYPRPAKLQIPNNKCDHDWKTTKELSMLGAGWQCKICGIVAYINPMA